MKNMSTKLHLIADKSGTFKGSSSNLSGKGFADMKFTVQAVEQIDFDNWISERISDDAASELDMARYADLAKPSVANQPLEYRLKDNQLYNKIVNKYRLEHSKTGVEN